MTEKIRLMLVDDHDVIRQGLTSLFEGYPEINVVAEARDGQEAVLKALEIKPDVILMDVTMPVMDGFEATRQIARQCEDCRVLALTVHEDPEFMIEMVDSGAWGFVTKRSLADDVVNAIHIVADGGYFLSPTFTKELVEDFRKLVRGETISRVDQQKTNPDQVKLEKLSDREKQVTKLVADGLSSIEIGKKLGISTKTVSRHRARIMDKLELNSTIELVKFAIRCGLSNLR